MCVCNIYIWYLYKPVPVSSPQRHTDSRPHSPKSCCFWQLTALVPLAHLIQNSARASLNKSKNNI